MEFADERKPGANAVKTVDFPVTQHHLYSLTVEEVIELAAGQSHVLRHKIGVSRL